MFWEWVLTGASLHFVWNRDFLKSYHIQQQGEYCNPPKPWRVRVCCCRDLSSWHEIRMSGGLQRLLPACTEPKSTTGFILLHDFVSYLRKMANSVRLGCGSFAFPYYRPVFVSFCLVFVFILSLLLRFSPGLPPVMKKDLTKIKKLSSDLFLKRPQTEAQDVKFVRDVEVSFAVRTAGLPYRNS